MTLASFPRGGKKPINNKTYGTFSFNKRQNLKPRTNRVNKPNEIEPIENKEKLLPRTAECMTFRRLEVGTVILGRIYAATDYEITVSLPGRISACIPITDISKTYTSLLQSLSASPKDYPPDFKLLSNLFKRGDYIICYVKNIDTESKQRVTLSIEPEFLNQYLDPGKLNKCSNIVCSISSVEDHGYSIDTGITNLRAFLKKEDIENDIIYYPGQQVFCVVKSIESSESVWTVKLSTKAKHVSSIIKTDGQSLDALVPGTKYYLTVSKIFKNGLCVTYNGDNVGCINQIYLEKQLSDYQVGEIIIGSLMYIIPIVKFAYFTQLTMAKEENIIESGEIIKNAKYLHQESGIYLSLKNGIKGFVSYIKTDLNFDDVKSVFVKNSVHKCRVLTYELMDRIHICTMQKDMLIGKNFIAETLKIGDVINVKIMNYKSDGFIFVTSGKIMGDVPVEDIMDIDEDIKNKPIEGKIYNARVLSKNTKGNRFLFTLKKSLIESNLPILSKFEDAKCGDSYEGTVVLIVPKQGLLVKFYGDVKGWLPINLLRPHSPENFKIGQIIFAEISNIKDDKKLVLKYKKRATKIKNEKINNEDFINLKIGDAVEGTVFESNETGIYLNFEIEINNDNKKMITGFCPAGHLSPSHEIGSSLALRYIPGDQLRAFIFSITPELLLTRTFLPEKNYPSLKRLNVDDSLPLSVKEINQKSIKVILPIKGMKDYVHVPFSKVDNISLLKDYSIIYGRVTSICKNDGVVNLTTQLKDISPKQKKKSDIQNPGIDALALYLTTIKDISAHQSVKSRPISSLYLGQVVDGIVEKVTENGLVLKLDNGASAIVRKNQMKDNFKKGYKIKGTVLWINYIYDIAEVTLLPHLLCGFSKDQFSWINRAESLMIKGEIILVTPWFALVRVGSHISAIPIRKHINDIDPNVSSYEIGQKIKCMIILSSPDTIIPLCMPTKELKKSVTSNKKRKNNEDVAASPAKKLKETQS